MDHTTYKQWISRLTSAKDTNHSDPKEKFTLRNDILWKETPQGLRRVIRLNEKHSVLYAAHSAPTSGHFKIGATTKKIKQRFWWPNIDSDIKEFVESCDECQRKDRPRRSHRLNPIPPKGIFKRVGIDMMGPLPLSENGNKYIIVAVDYLTKWPEAKAIPNGEAETVAQFVFEDIICRHGCPDVIQSDGGKSFDNKLHQALCDRFGICHTVVAAYHPQANGLVERLNQVIAVTISKYVASDPRPSNWEQFIPSALFAYRTTQQASTKFTPFFLTYGREARLPLDLEFPSEAEDTAETFEQRVHNILAHLDPARNQAIANIAQAQVRQKKQYDKHVRLRTYNIGDLVLKYRSEWHQRHDKKFAQMWEGPFYIHQVPGFGKYTLRTKLGHVIEKEIAGDRLKPYKERAPQTQVVISQQ